MIKEEELKSLLIKEKIIDDANIEEVIKKSHEEGKNLQNYLIDKNLASEPQLYEIIARHLKYPFIDLKDQIIRKDILDLIPEPIVQVHGIFAFDKTKEEMKVACLDPFDLQTFEFIEKKTNLKPIIYVTTPESVKSALKQYHKGLKAEFKEISQANEETVSAEKDLKKLAEDLPVVRIVDTVLEYAIFEAASDIHIEPTETDTVIRYRIDGILKDVMTLPKNVQTGVVARIKILSNLKIDEHRLPQDGRFKINIETQKVSFRVSIIPVFDGEKVVLRLLRESAQVSTLEQLGFLKKQLEIVKKNMKKPHGVVLVTGPTGSGKTTTLYSIMHILNSPKINISTIEDPIEYRMPRINQSQVNPRIGFTFATGLRSLLRQDPNIIMVGEIRDKETAEIAIHSAMTGHLVLSTLHTNDAATALPRLEEMGVPSFLIASTTNIIIAQRLVRKICLGCIESYALTKKNIEQLEKQVNFKEILNALEREGAIISANQPLDTLLFYRGKGCKKCNGEGYKGRIGIYEILENTENVTKLILEGSSSGEIQKAAEKDGMITITQDGFVKAKMGITTIEEILRVTQE
ncbi:MAG: ATPase, T2SS/T4P/T4SS family [Patescibacteria group bacterium]